MTVPGPGPGPGVMAAPGDSDSEQQSRYFQLAMVGTQPASAQHDHSSQLGKH